MKIEEAIKVLEVWNQNTKGEAHPKRIEATQLGIEALKRCEKARVKGTIWDYSLLPGETK